MGYTLPGSVGQEGMAQLPSQIFREYDIRGVVGTDLTEEVARSIGRGFAAYLRQAGAPLRVLVGQDNRMSSPQVAAAVADGLAAGGCDVVDIGTVITPAFYYARVHLGIDGGVMVTASHNPPEYNGMKLAFGHATLYGEEIQQVRRLAEEGQAAEEESAAAGGLAQGRVGAEAVAGGRRGRVEAREVLSAYRRMLSEKIVLGPRRLRVAVDCGNGTASLVAPDVIEAWGCQVLRQHCDSDPTYPHHLPNPVAPENVRDLIDLVRRERCDLGIGFDGDGDRIGVIDDRGEIVWGDMLMALFWREILPRYPGAPVIVEVKCSQALVEEVTRLGGRPFFYRTGHSLIKAKMKELGAVFTGEMSGHMFFADEYYGYDDAVYAAGRLLRLLSHTTEPLSALLATIPHYPVTPEVYVDAPDEVKFEVVRQVAEEFKARGYPVVDVDGARVIFPDGWGLVRASNTQPALVVRAEGGSEEGLRRIKRAVEEVLARYSHVGPLDW
ncbi:MAG: phosphomannomutase/phosphoglucomutase [Armatimonadota bacterium]|nr:phosphomannomutase/phosphoglucomutase [Armatimonadota bacterium]MDR7469710.1 phosphomannomutase/phosphoglucomutase [Armatimonadota bacterium]MDR7473957.1 phosphomannomutase/phosphoglucomutase [Armatimonadota bacterium]